jgi:hypothetical protein
MSDQNPQDPHSSPYFRPGEGGMPSYPTGGPSAPTPAPQQPDSIALAVKLMYAGAAVSLLSSLVSLLTLGSLRDTIEESVRETDPNASQSTLDAAYAFGIVSVVVLSLISVALWLWMAWKNGQGRSWARIVATVFGVINVLFLLGSFTQPGATTLSLTFGVILAVLGVAVLVLLWKRESSQYYDAVTRSRQLR